jgi:probable HAF family extracellular repeat protein
VKSLLLAAALATSLVLAVPAGTGAQPSMYNLTDLGTLGGVAAGAAAISPNEQIVGGSLLAGFFPREMDGIRSHPFLWTRQAGMVDLGRLDGYSAQSASWVTAGGLVVGSAAKDGFSSHAFAWTREGEMIDLGPLDADPYGFSEAHAVSAKGQVVGAVSTSRGSAAHAFSWTRSGGMIDLGTLGAGSWASGVSANGMVVGQSETEPRHDMNANPPVHAFLWTPATGMKDLGTLGGSESAAVDVTPGGLVVGWSTPAGSTVIHAVMWPRSGGIVDLGSLEGTSLASEVTPDGRTIIGRTGGYGFVWTAGTGMVKLSLGGSSSVAAAVNARGVVVGFSALPNGQPMHAFVWTAAAGIVDLGTLGGSKSIASGINAKGEIVGSASTPGDAETHAVLWVPNVH